MKKKDQFHGYVSRQYYQPVCLLGTKNPRTQERGRERGGGRGTAGDMASTLQKLTCEYEAGIDTMRYSHFNETAIIQEFEGEDTSGHTHHRKNGTRWKKDFLGM